MVVVSSEQGVPSVASQALAKRSELEQGVRADPLVQAVLARFPGAEIVGVRRRGATADAPDAPGEPDDEPPQYDAGEPLDDDN